MERFSKIAVLPLALSLCLPVFCSKKPGHGATETPAATKAREETADATKDAPINLKGDRFIVPKIISNKRKEGLTVNRKALFVHPACIPANQREGNHKARASPATVGPGGSRRGNWNMMTNLLVSPTAQDRIS